MYAPLHSRPSKWDNASYPFQVLQHMPKMRMTTAPLLAGPILLLLAGSLAAQQAVRPAAPPPAPAAAQNEAAPQSTTATYGDWVVQCQTRTEPTPGQVCDMAQVAQVQGKNVPFSRVAIARPEKGQPVKLILQVPVNASFGSPVRFQTGEANPELTAPFASCVPNGCFAQFDLNEETMKRLRAAPTAGKLSFADAGGHEIAVPVSFNGFSQAFDALIRK
jgi:invasion protein IalB